MNDSDPLQMPAVGSYGLRVLSPTLLELTLINSKEPDGRVSQWNFVGDNSQLNLPSPQEFTVLAGVQQVAVQKVGFKRRVLYAPVKRRDLRIANHLYLELAAPIPEGQTVEVKNPSDRLWLGNIAFTASVDPLRWSPAIHVNQVGYVPAFSKQAMVGYYLGSLGEMRILTPGGFQLVDAASGAVAYQGALKLRADRGYTYSPTPYQQVFEADFSAFKKPGEYRLAVPGLGVSFPFFITDGAAAAFARTFALGLYHQRCGMKNEFPWTRFTHEDCHTEFAEVPTLQFNKTQGFLADVSSDYKNESRHTAPQLKDVNSSLYPFVNPGEVEVSGGHHDAGDYSKYTINSAGLIHHLVFAADAFSGVGALDNLGLPESGDGKSDLLQEAKWEADFLAKMQDTDGGFYFLVYPRDRRYEDDVLPDRSDRQVVWPKNTAVTAAAVAALAEAGSSPLLQKQFPDAAALYLEKAALGWAFLEKAIAAHGKDGAYQKMTHYGHEFMHDDELAWAAAAMFVATGDPAYQEKLKAWFKPQSVSSRRWNWWRLFEGYGCAARTYAFAARSGRLSSNQLDSAYLAQCEAELTAAAQDQLRFARESAYGTSFPEPNKQYRSAGWFFSSERAFDLTVAYQLSRKPEFLEAIVSNMNYEGGCNPVNVSYVTGLGWKRQRDVVHQYAQNDRRVLPPSGLPLGNVQASFMYLYHYKQELTGLSFPEDWAATAPYPFYDRWGDSFNTATEFVVVDQARTLASLAFLMSLTEVKDQPWKSAPAQIAGLPSQIPTEHTVSASLFAPDLDLSQARIVWEARDQEPSIGPTFTFAPKNPGEQWVEAEAQLPDGRRVFATTKFIATFSLDTPPNSYQAAISAPSSDTVALFHLDNDGVDATGKHGELAFRGRAALDPSNIGWMADRVGAALSVEDLDDRAIITLPGRSLYSGPETSSITLEAMLYINEYRAYNRGNARILSLSENWNASLELVEDAYTGPQIKGGTQLGIPGSAFKGALSLKQWHHLSLRLDRTGYTVKIDGITIGTQESSELGNWANAGSATLEIGNFNGWIDEVVIRTSGTSLNDNPVPLAASKPTIRPNGGIFSRPVPVTLKSTTPGAAIRYTTNGSDPTGAAKLYESPFTLTNSATIKAKAYVMGVSESEVATATVTIEAPSSAASKATFVKTDATTQGNWKGQYGAEGYVIMGHTAKHPSYARVIPVAASDYTWAESTSDPRALQKVSGTSRLASCWYSGASFIVDLDLTDGQAHRIALYCLDWDRVGRSETIEISDLEGTVLDRQTVSDFAGGKYLVWDIQGKIRIQITKITGPNAVLMGLLFDSSPQQASPPPAPSLPSRVSSIQRLPNGDCLIRVTGEPGQTLTLEASGDLKTWAPISTQVLTSGEAEFTDTEARSFPGRFYRPAP